MAFFENVQTLGQIPDGTFINTPADGAGFRTTSAVGDGATFDSGVLDLTNYTQVATSVVADVDGTLRFIFGNSPTMSGTTVGQDGVDRLITVPYTSASGYQYFSAPAFTPYVRYEFTNTAGQGAAGQFFFDTRFLTKSVSGQLLRMDGFISPAMVANLGKNVIVGQKLNNSYDTVPLDSTGNLRVHVTEPLAAFGELRTIEVSPQIQSEFAYGINTDQFNITTSGTFTSAYGTDSMAIISCSGTNTSAVVESKGYSKYRPGQGSLARFTGLFTTGVANNTQRVGLFDESDGFGFGYNGTDFGLFNIRNGTTTWTPQSAWNIDVMDGSGSSSNPSNQLLDPTKGNVFQVNYQYLGFGAIKYFVEEATTGRFEPVHTIQYANANTVPSLGIPSLPLRFDVINTSNSSEVIFKTGSVAAFTEGKNIVLGPFNSISNTKSVTTETNILTIKGKDTFNGKTNRISVQLQELSIGCDGNATSTIRVTKDATLGGSPSYTSISDQSSVEYDTAGTTVSGGVVISQQAVAKNQNSTVNLQEFNLFLLPGETLTFSSESTATNATTIAVSWREDF